MNVLFGIIIIFGFMLRRETLDAQATGQLQQQPLNIPQNQQYPQQQQLPYVQSQAQPYLGQTQNPQYPSQYQNQIPNQQYTNPQQGIPLQNSYPSSNNNLYPNSQIPSYSSYGNQNYPLTAAQQQENAEAQQSTAYIFSQISALLSNPETRQNGLALLQSLRSTLSDPTAFSSAGTTNYFSNLSNPSGSMSNFHAGKIGALLELARDINRAKGRAIDRIIGNTPMIGSLARAGNAAVGQGINAVEGLVSPFVGPSTGTLTGSGTGGSLQRVAAI